MCRTPCTTKRAISSIKVPAWVGAWAWATSGHITMSPSNKGKSPRSGGDRSGPRLAPVGPLTTSSTSPPSMGNESTSVGPGSFMCSTLRSAMSADVTKKMLSSVPPRTPSSTRTAPASRCQRSTSTSTTVCSSAQKTSGSVSPPILGRRRNLGGPSTTGILFIGGHDVTNDAVTNHVTGIEMHECQTVNTSQYFLKTRQPTSTIGYVYLGDVTGDDYF